MKKPSKNNARIVKLAAHRKLKASEEEIEALIDALLEDGDGDRGLNFESCGCGLFLFSEDLDPDWRETAPKKFLTLLGQIIRNNGFDYLSLGESITGAGLHVGSERGREVRIKADGSIWDPTLIWGRRIKHPRIAPGNQQQRCRSTSDFEV